MTNTTAPVAPPTSDPSTTAPANPRITKTGTTRSASKSGGVQVVLDETGSWGNLNRDHNDDTGRSSGEGEGGVGHKKGGGMLGFLSRKKGRDRSPKPMEKGVLGKEGARVVVGGR